MLMYYSDKTNNIVFHQLDTVNVVIIKWVSLYLQLKTEHWISDGFIWWAVILCTVVKLYFIHVFSDGWMKWMSENKFFV